MSEDYRKEWYEEASKQTLETLPDFLQKLANYSDHDYDSICVALAAGAVGAAWALNASPSGGITGFQAGAVMWEFMKAWNGIEAPARLLQFKNMLYPQYEAHFDKLISLEAWKLLQEMAKKNLEEHPDAASRVVEHWQSIVDGAIPFGYRLSED